MTNYKKKGMKVFFSLKGNSFTTVVKINTLHPNIVMHILHTVLSTFLKVPTRRARSANQEEQEVLTKKSC